MQLIGMYIILCIYYVYYMAYTFLFGLMLLQVRAASFRRETGFWEAARGHATQIIEVADIRVIQSGSD